MSLDNIKIVLVRTFHPGNIGSAARSMKTMGLSKLCLVAPKDFPSEQANQMAAGADDMLSNVQIVDSVTEAISECTVVVASTARIRGYDLPELSPRQAAELLVDGARIDVNKPDNANLHDDDIEAANTPTVALIFGPERMGLHNEDIQHAKYRVTIPANPEYSSLNLAAAVQTLSYEIFKYAHQALPAEKNIRELPTSADVERLHVHLEKVLRDIQFLRPHQGETLERLRNLINRAEPDVLEMNILRGILSSIERSLEHK